MFNSVKRLLRVQYASNLYLDVLGRTPFQPILKPSAPVLALAGNIGRPECQSYADFLHYCSRNWAAVFVIAGNHEIYNSKPADKRLATCRSVASKFSNVHFLNRRCVNYGGVTFIGMTLWTAGHPHMNDYKMICAEHDRAWLSAEIAACEEVGQPAVVLTHTMPSVCDELIREPVRAWIAGNSHTGCTIHREVMGGGTITCTCNPRGYPGEIRTGYCPELFVDVNMEGGKGADARDPLLIQSAEMLV